MNETDSTETHQQQNEPSITILEEKSSAKTSLSKFFSSIFLVMDSK